MKPFSLIVLLTAAAIFFWTASVVNFYRYSAYKRRLRSYLGEKRREKPRGSLKERIVKGYVNLGIKFTPVGQRFRFFTDFERLERQLALAGNPLGLDVGGFLGLRFLTLVTGLIAGEGWMFLGLPFGPPVFLLLVLAGLFLPSLWVSYTAKVRQERIALDLPDFLDGMSVTLQAGVPLEVAMNQVVEQMEGPLAEELRRFNKEMELGVPREEAYRRLVSRNDCEELETMAQTLLQSFKLGVPVAKTFKTLAEDMRLTRYNRLKEKAAKAAPKVTLVTSFVIMPGVMIAILGLILLNILYNPSFIGLGGLR